MTIDRYFFNRAHHVQWQGQFLHIYAHSEKYSRKWASNSE